MVGTEVGALFQIMTIGQCCHYSAMGKGSQTNSGFYLLHSEPYWRREFSLLKKRGLPKGDQVELNVTIETIKRMLNAQSVAIAGDSSDPAKFA